MPGTIRKRFVVSGNVQEAGYRVFVKPIAKSMGIAGFVRNLPDETVEVVCEAEPGALDKFIKAIDRKGNPANPHDINVASISETAAPEGVQYNTFKIEYNGTLSPEEREQNREMREERMIVGASILSENVECVGRDVRDMHSDMNTRFDHMAQRYDLIANSLVKAIDRIDAGFERMDRNSKETYKAIEQSRKETAAQFKQSRDESNRANKEIVVSNRELAKAVKFMITKLSNTPTRKRPVGKRKR